ncbi:MAG: hypothetical protein ABSB11_03370 [Sedimentisphaerales bacterium]|jgi:hypothetical protein
MMRNDSNNWLERLLAKHLYHEPVKFDFQRWSEKHPEESRLLEGGFKDSGRTHETTIFYVLRCIMKSNVTRYSAAAVVALAIGLVLLDPFGWSKHSGILLADVQKKIAQTDTMVMRGQKIFTCTDDPNKSVTFDVVKYASKVYGHTEEGYIGGKQIYRLTFNLPEKQIIAVLPKPQKYLAFPATDEQLKIVEKMTPEGVIDLLLQADYKKLGTGDINGVEAEGFEFHDVNAIKDIMPKFLFDLKEGKGVVWVGVKELLPVKLEADMVIGPSVLTRFTEYRLHEFCVLESYNVELGEELFSTAVPEGYTELKISDCLPVKAGVAGGAGLGAVSVGLIVAGKKLRKRKTVRPVNSV